MRNADSACMREPCVPIIERGCVCRDQSMTIRDGGMEREVGEGEDVRDLDVACVLDHVPRGHALSPLIADDFPGVLNADCFLAELVLWRGRRRADVPRRGWVTGISRCPLPLRFDLQWLDAIIARRGRERV